MFHPSRAERAQTVLRAAAAVTVLTMPDQSGAASTGRSEQVGVHATDDAGRPLVLVPAGSALALSAATEQTAVIHAVDVCPTPLPDRIRGEAWIGGWLSVVPEADRVAAILSVAARQPDERLFDAGQPGSAWALLRLDVAEVRLRDVLCGDGELAQIDPQAFTGALPDPLIDGEADWLGHLVTGHPAEFAQLCLLIPESARPDGATLRPIGLDRYGLLFRIGHGGSHRQVRIAFPTPVGRASQLPRAMAELLRSAAAAHHDCCAHRRA